MSEKIIWLIRHGRTALQEEKRYQGSTDEPLSAEGRAELGKAEILPERVYVSPLLRARETAFILFPAAEQIVVPGLKEMDFGVFEGRNYQEMEHDTAYRTWVDGMCLGRCPGGESRRDYCDRVCTAFTAVLSQAEDAGDDPVVIVAHGGTQMAVLDRFAEKSGDPAGAGEASAIRNTAGGDTYYSWQLPSGHGYILKAEQPGPGAEPVLYIFKKLDFTK